MSRTGLLVCEMLVIITYAQSLKIIVYAFINKPIRYQRLIEQMIAADSV